MPGCLNRDMLEKLAGGELSDADTRRAEGHVLDCRRCAAVLSKLTTGQGLLERIRDLERSRQDVSRTLSMLPQSRRRLTETLFGDQDTQRA